RPDHVARARLRPCRVSRLIIPVGLIDDLWLAERFLETRDPPAHRYRNRHARLDDEIQRGSPPRRHRRDARCECTRADPVLHHVACVLTRTGRGRDEEIPAADECWRIGLLENDLADTEERGHDADAEAKSGRKHGGSPWPRRQRSEREPRNHAAKAPLFM